MHKVPRCRDSFSQTSLLLFLFLFLFLLRTPFLSSSFSSSFSSLFFPTGRCAYLPSVTCYRQSIKPPPPPPPPPPLSSSSSFCSLSLSALSSFFSSPLLSPLIYLLSAVKRELMRLEQQPTRFRV